MDARQKIRDFTLLLKQDRKTQVIVVAVLLFLAWGILGDNAPKRRFAVQEPQALKLGTGSIGGREAYEDLVTRLGSDISEIRISTEKNSEISNQLQQNMELYEKRTAEIFKKIIERMADIESNISTGNQPVSYTHLTLPTKA